jgi:putative acetyltransferase
MTVDNLVIRRAEPTDYVGIAQTFTGATAAANTLQDPFPSEAQWKERLQSAAKNHVLVALIDGKVVGHGGLTANENPRRAHCRSLGMTVTDEWQGRGIGTRLMQALLDLADNWLGVLRIELTVFTDNVHAVRLYERHGFVVEGTHRAHFLRLGKFADVHAMARFHPNPPQVPRT